MNDVNGSSKNDKRENAAIHFTQERNLFSESNPTSSAQNLPGEIYVSEANGAPDVYHLSNLPKLVPMDKDNKKLSTYDRLTGSSYWILFWLCWASFVQGLAVNGFINTSVTTIERRYNLKSADAGFFAAMYDVGSVLFSVPVSYLGSRAGASKPKWISIGIFLMCMGSFVYTIPHFASPMYEAARQTNVRDVFLCHSGSNATSLCKEKGERWISNFRYVFIFGQFLHGVGASPLYTLGITYLHESFSLNSASLYLAIFYSVAIIGPACGYVVGGQLLNIYIDSPAIEADQVGLRPTNPQWLGAWWISFFISAVLAFICALAILTFPAKAPYEQKNAVARDNQGGQVRSRGSIMSRTDHSFDDLKNFFSISKQLVCNATFVFLSIAGACEGILLTGFSTFMPKFIQFQFSTTSRFSAFIVGAVVVPAGGGGTILGGYLIKRYKLDLNSALKLCLMLSILIFFVSFGFVISCPDQKMAGVNVPYYDRPLPRIPNLISNCNLKCGCRDVAYDPVCGSDQTMYFSPCHAGCMRYRIVQDKTKEFSDCSCIIGSNSSYTFQTSGKSTSKPEGGVALKQTCGSTCNLLPAFLLVGGIVMILTFMISLPAVSSTLRSVPDNDRSLALGIQWIIIRVFGTIPGPILLGLVIDNSCKMWQKTCSVKGSCTNYNNVKMSRSFMAVSVVFKFLASVFYFLAWKFDSLKSRRVSSLKNEIKVQNSEEDNHLEN